MMAFLRLVRYKNLIIVALTQYLLQYVILLPELQNLALSPLLSNGPFALLVLSTVLIAASGYIINDIEDRAIDALNKPLHKRVVGYRMSVGFAWLLYALFVVIGFLISLYLAFYIHDLLQLLIYPLAVLLLAAYSIWFKKMPLIGNVVVAFFCAFVAWVVYYAESINTAHTLLQPQKAWQHLQQGQLSPFDAAGDYVFIVFLGYAALAFWATLLREIVKDMEDAEGDGIEHCRTLPLVVGFDRTKKIVYATGIIFVGCILIFSFWIKTDLWRVLVLNFFTTIPTVYALLLLAKAEKKADFTFLSGLTKAIMLSGLIFILIMI